MIPRTYQVAKRAVHHLVEGDSVKETLVGLLVGHARLEVHGLGRVDGIRIEGEAPRRGEHLVLSLSGAVSNERVHLAIVAKAADGTIVAGLLDEARAVDLELSIELLDPVSEKETNVSNPAPPKIKSASTSTTSWADVAAASAKAQALADAEEAAEVEAATPSLGDLIDHATFGRCVVEKMDDDEEFVMVRTTNRRLLRLSLDVLRLERTGEEEGHGVFKARGKKA